VDANLLYRKLLERRRLRDTAGRRSMLREIASLDRAHFSAEELVARFRGRGERVSRATVYRTLEHLVQGGLLERLSLGGRHSRFERKLGRRRHEHLTCVGCGKVTEFASPALDRLLEGICRRRRFSPRQHVLQVTGICRNCAAGGPAAAASRRRGGRK
jgi:Fur family ferric uptake transcriptional regulator